MRSEFEKWATNTKGWHTSRREDGEYIYHEQGWIAWQAASTQHREEVEKLRALVGNLKAALRRIDYHGIPAADANNETWMNSILNIQNIASKALTEAQKVMK